jgi:acetyltransferase-like isoleucine patch superfamily enzyme
VTIGRGSTIACTGVLARPGEGISIGDRVGISEYAHLGGQGGIEIGNDVIFGPGVHVFSENHRFSETSRPIRDQGEERAAVVIEDDCWIGAGATILAGVRIGTGSVVGSRAVVIADVPPRSVVVGVPARLVSTRKDEP